MKMSPTLDKTHHVFGPDQMRVVPVPVSSRRQGLLDVGAVLFGRYHIIGISLATAPTLRTIQCLKKNEFSECYYLISIAVEECG